MQLGGPDPERRRARRRAERLLAGLLLSCLSCVNPPHDFKLEPDQVGAPGVERFLMLPLNVAVSLPEEFEKSVPRVSEQMLRYIESHGRQVDSISAYEGHQLWIQSVKQAGVASRLVAGFDSAVVALTKQLAKTRSFDAVVMPSLVFRKAQLSRRTASWDGVKRRIRIVSYRKSDSIIRTLSFGDGTITAVSLHIFVFSSDGIRVFESFAGIEVAHEVAVFEREYQFELREDLLDDDDVLRDGIALAFDPYLPQKRAR